MVQYESKPDANPSNSPNSSFADPSITLYSPDDFRHWRNQNPEPKNIICFLPLSIHFELSFRQLFTSGFDIVDVTPEKIVMPRDFTLRCKPLSDKELFYLGQSYGENGERVPKFNKKEVFDFIGLIGSARHQFALTHLTRGGKCHSMYNIADLSDQYVVQNVLEFPDDAIQDFDVFSAYKRIRHTFVTNIEQFQTDQYLVQNGTLIGIFYDLSTNPTHSKSKLISNVNLNLFSNRFKTDVSGTFLELPSNHRNRRELDICGHLGHKIHKQKQLPRPVSVRGASVWDVSNHRTPSPLYKKEPKQTDSKSNITIFGKKPWGKTSKNLFKAPRIVDIDLSKPLDPLKHLKKVAFINKQPPIQVFQALTGDSPTRTLDLSADVNNDNLGQTDIPNPSTNNAPIAALDTSIDYQNPIPGPSNRSPTGRHQPVQATSNVHDQKAQATLTRNDNPNSSNPNNSNLTTYSDFFNNWRLTFVYKGPNMPTVNETNRSTDISDNWVNVLGDLHRFQSQFKNQFQQLLKEYQTRMVSTNENEEALVPEPQRAVLMMNEINMLARSIQNNSSDFDKLRDHITQCVFGIVSTFYSSEISRPQLNPSDFSGLNPTLTVTNEIIAYLDNVRDSLMNLRPFPTTANSNHNPKESKMLKLMEDFHNGIKPFLDAIVQKYEATKTELDSVINAPGSSASNTPNITPPQQSTQKQGKDGNFDFKSDGSSPHVDKRDDPVPIQNQGIATNRDEPMEHEQTVPSDVLDNKTEITAPHSNVSKLPSGILAILETPNNTSQVNIEDSKDRNEKLPELEDITVESIPRTPDKPKRAIGPVVEIQNSPGTRKGPKSKKGRFTISSDSDTENKNPERGLNRSNIASRLRRKRSGSNNTTTTTNKRKKR